MPSPLFVGIDVSSQDNVVCCLTRDEEKRPLSRFTVSNNRPGITEFCQRIVSLIQKHGFDQILFGLEHTGCCYSTHVGWNVTLILTAQTFGFTCLTRA